METFDRFLSAEARRVRQLSVDSWGDPVEIVGQSRALTDVLGKVARVAPYHEPVLVIGESGAGKEALAQALYLLGSRRGRPYVSVNCPQYQDGNLTVSELFGHRRGSFTGAIADRKGSFETANDGVIFLDEIADLHMSAQVMLLRCLACGEFQPLGSDTRLSVNVRVVAATNRPLEKLMVANEFRHDLFFRLRYFLITLPPLRERGDDWELLLEYALWKLHLKYGVERKFSRRALDVLSRNSWPGNVRQLMSIATQGYAMASGVVIEPEDFQDEMESHGLTEDDTAADLYHRVAVQGEGFWSVVYDPFMDRELNRHQVRDTIRKGLFDTGGSYQELLQIFRIPRTEYQKFMDFLRHHRLKP